MKNIKGIFGVALFCIGGVMLGMGVSPSGEKPMIIFEVIRPLAFYLSMGILIAVGLTLMILGIREEVE